MAKTRVFISFDYDHDLELKEGLVGQSRLQDSPFSIANWSLQEAAPQASWEAAAEARIQQVDVVVVMLGYNTHQAPGVLKEVGMANRHRVRVVQLRPQNRSCTPVPNAGPVIEWTWDNLKQLLS
jgi:hypothetical protein